MTLANVADDIVRHYAPHPEMLQQRLVNVGFYYLDAPLRPADVHFRAPFQVKKPERERPTDDQFFYGNNKPNVAFLRRHFHAEGRLHESQAIYILEKAKEVFSQEPNVLDIDAPVTSRPFHDMICDVNTYLRLIVSSLWRYSRPICE
jgi:hypothetical protein